MLRTLKLQGYRGFGSYELNGLTRVNLLVGKNNCGKTSILEAINILVSGGSPSVLDQIARRRGEVNVPEDSEAPYKRESGVDISHFFLGHSLSLNAGFSLASDENRVEALVDVIPVEYFRDESLRALFDDEIENTPDLGLRITHNENEVVPVLPVSLDGLLLMSRYLRSPHWRRRSAAATPVVQFLAPDSLYPVSMRDMWDQVLIDGRETDVIDAMQILDPTIKNVHFLTGNVFRSFSGKAGVLVGFHDNGQRVPLGSLGDGMRRLLALSLSLIKSTNGTLLNDEIDTGLHWTTMEEMWRLIVHTAKKSNVQVFATTHSYDCIRGLASLVESDDEVTSEVSIQKVDPSLARAVKLDAKNIRIAVAQDIEVR